MAGAGTRWCAAAAASAVAVVAGIGTGVGMARAGTSAPAPTSMATGARAGTGALDTLRFEPNVGQTNGAAKFVIRGAGHAAYLTANDAVFILSKPSAPAGPAAPGSAGKPNAKTAPATPASTSGGSQPDPSSVAGDVVYMHLDNANPNPTITTEGRLPGVTNYLIGKDPSKWQTNVPSYSQVTYHGIYPGVDLVYRAGAGGNLEYDYVVAPGASTDAIDLQFQGADSVAAGTGGGIAVSTSAGEIVQGAPGIYQDTTGGRSTVSGGYVPKPNNRVGFRVGPHDASRPVVIDPLLVYSTYLGGTTGFGNEALAVASDSAGNTYVTGDLLAVADFPTTPGAFQTTFPGTSFPLTGDAFVSKLNHDGSALLYSTYLGGNAGCFFCYDRGQGIAVDSAGHAFVTGWAESTDFPTTSNAFQPTRQGSGGRDQNVFLTELNPGGTGLLYSTFLGGSGGANANGEAGVSVQVDGSGHALVAGATGSPDFPVTPNAYQASCRSNCETTTDGVSVLNSTAYTSATAVFNTFDVGQSITGTNIPAGTTIAAVNSTTSITLSAAATGAGAGLTFTIPVFSRDRPNAFLAKFDTTQSGSASLTYSTLLGGGQGVGVSGMGLDATGAAYLTGSTTSTDFPTTAGAYQAVCGSSCVTFADGILDADLVTLHSPSASFTQADAGGSLDIYGTLLSTGTHIATVVNATTATLDTPGLSPGPTSFTMPFRRPSGTPFLARLDPALGAAALTSSTFFDTGGPGSGFTTAVAVDGAGSAYLTGSTSSATFPTTAGAFDRACHDTTNSPCGVTPTFTDGVSNGGSKTFTSASARFDPNIDRAGNAITGTNIPANTTIAGVVSATTITLSQPATATGTGLSFTLDRSNNGTDGFVTKFNASGSALVYSTYVGGDYDDAFNAIAVDAAGRAAIVGGTLSGAGTYPIRDQMTAGVPIGGAVITEFSADGSSLAFSNMFGAGSANGVSIDGSGVVHVAGSTGSPDFPTTPGVLQPTFGGGARLGNAFVIAIAPVPASAPVVTGMSAAHGPLRGGQVVTLDGRGLTGATGVSFGSAPASFAVNSDTRITVTTPSQPAPPNGTTLVVPVKVTTAGGASPANPVDLYTYGEGVWTATAPASQPRHGASVALLRNGKVLVAAGSNTENGSGVTAAELYDPATATWTPTGSLNATHIGGAAILLNDGRVLVVGGDTTAVEIYDPAAISCGSNGCWTMVSPLPSFAAGFTATLLPSGKVLVAGGNTNGSVTAAAEVYDPATNNWSAVGSMTTPRTTATATPLRNGKVLIAGGWCFCNPGPGSATEPSAELFDPAATGCGTGITGCFTATGSMGQGRFGHSATLLPDGNVMVAGGDNFSPRAFISVELYDASAGTWSLVGLLQTPRLAQQATLLPDGRVLITGGQFSVFNEGVSSVEIVDPADPSSTTAADRLLTGRGQSLNDALANGQSDFSTVLLPDGQVLAVGGSGDATAELYTPAPRVTAVSPSSGLDSGGTSVSVTGTSFIGTPRVLFGGVQATSVVVNSPTQLTATTPAEAAGAVDVTVSTAAGTSPTSSADRFTFVAPPPPPNAGYWLVASDGGVFPFGAAGGFGSTGAVRLNQPIVGMAATPSRKGYWLVAADGGVFPFGDANGYGSTGAVRLNRPVVGMAATPDGKGYWLVAADGGIFPFGDANGYGSTGAVRLNKPVVGMAATRDGGGYWLVAADGGIFPFGDAAGHGSTGAVRLNRPVVGMAATPDGGGYWLVASDGGIFPFGDAAGLGSTGAIRLNKPVVGMATTSDGGGYWLVASDGGIFPFGDAPGLGSTGAVRLNKPMVGMAGR